MTPHELCYLLIVPTVFDIIVHEIKSIVIHPTIVRFTSQHTKLAQRSIYYSIFIEVVYSWFEEAKHLSPFLLSSTLQ